MIAILEDSTLPLRSDQDAISQSLDRLVDRTTQSMRDLTEIVETHFFVGPKDRKQEDKLQEKLSWRAKRAWVRQESRIRQIMAETKELRCNLNTAATALHK